MGIEFWKKEIPYPYFHLLEEARMDRYMRNMEALSKEECDLLSKSKVALVGCGGLGGYIIEMVARIGLGYIRAIDGDVFEISNLNRQILAREDNLGKNKAREAYERIKLVNSQVEIVPIEEYLDEKNAGSLLEGLDIVIDALDNIPSRILVEKTCKDLKIPLVHGSIGGFYGQVATIFPGDDTLKKIYRGKESGGIEEIQGNLSFMAGLIASIQAGEVVKLITGKGDLLKNQVLFIDGLSQEYTKIIL